MNKKTIIVLIVVVVVLAALYIIFKLWFSSGSAAQRKTEPMNGQIYTADQEVLINQEMASTPYNREEAIQMLVSRGLLPVSK